MDITDRPSALLTPRQRELLHGGFDFEDRGHRAARSRIRNRLRASIFDIGLIVSELPLDDIDKAFTESDEDEPDMGALLPVATAMKSLPALLYLYNREAEPEAENDADGWATALDVRSGIIEALTRMDVGHESVDVNIAVERAEDLETLAERELTELSHDQLTQLHRRGFISSTEFHNAWAAKKD